MFKNKRIPKITAVLFASLLLFGATSQRANALLVDTFETVVLASLETIETLILKLSDDIGVMADRIVYTEELIGEMADRIVHTEELVVEIADKQNSLSLILSPEEGEVVSSTIPVQITLSDPAVDYILYISNNADMSDSTNALVHNNDTTAAWSRVPDFSTGDKLYIAVTTVEDSSISNISNTVMLNLQ